ncbi:hypothetical protein EB001_15125 [bacterium]|nr:hypothetical protein [bacterium]
MDYQIYYKLDQQIDGQKLLGSIQELINKFQKNNSGSIPILCIGVKSITYDNTTIIPKLEHTIQEES